jgi:hypothetical protein
LHLRRDLQQILAQRLEALLHQVLLGERVHPAPDRGDGPDDAWQAGQQDAGSIADVVSPARDSNESRGSGDRIDLSRPTGGCRRQDVVCGRSRERDIVQVEIEAPRDQVRIVARRASCGPRTPSNAVADPWAGRERTAHPDIAIATADYRR